MEKLKIIVCTHKADDRIRNYAPYVPVHGGKALHPDMDLGFIGDDTGDNISDKKANYSELTVQHWAWKNIKADYYGLCHYRRYLSFSKHSHKAVCHEAAFVDSFTDIILEEFGLLDDDSMRNTIRQYDMVLNKEFNVKDVTTIRGIKYDTVYSIQDAPIVAYPQEIGYTRITEYKKLPVQQGAGSTYAVEYPLPYTPDSNAEPYYPVLTAESQAQYLKYLKEAQKVKNLILCGRLADFQYYNMDQALERALTVFETVWNRDDCRHIEK